MRAIDKRLTDLERKANTDEVKITVCWDPAPDPPGPGVIQMRWPEDDRQPIRWPAPGDPDDIGDVDCSDLWEDGDGGSNLGPDD